MFVALGLVLTFGLLTLAGPSAGERDRHPEPDDERATEQQIRELVEQFGPLLYGVAYAVTHDRGLAEDVVQDALFRAWTSMPSWEDDVPVRWLRRVTRNRAISVMRKEGRSLTTDHWADLASAAPATDRLVEGRERMVAVRDALAQLDEPSRTMIVLRETEELSYDELAEIVGLTPSAVRAKLYRARHALRQQLEDWELQ